MDKKPDKPNSIRLDVYELKNYKPVLNYRINVSDKIILSVDNNDIPPRGATKCVNEPIKEYLEITPLTPIENLDYGSQLTHRFQIKKLGWKDLFLNLTDNDLIKLGFKVKPKTFWQKLFDFSLNGVWLWLERIGFVLAIATGIIGLFQFLSNSCQQQVATKPLEKLTNQIDSKTNSTDSTYISKTDSLTKKLK